MPTVAHALLDVLRAEGLRTVFGLPGGTVMPVYDALGDRPELRVITTRHETAAVFAAMGHARVSPEPVLVLVTSGPGLTNTLTGLAAAAAEELPIVVVAGEVATSSVGRFALQDGSASGLDVLALTRPIARRAERVERPEHVGSVLRRALTEARGQRPGPVVLALPIDVARAEHGCIADAPLCRPPVLAPDSAACARAARVLARARRPFFVLGRGARGEGVADRVTTLARHLGAGVAVTAHGKGAFPETDPHWAGVLGFGGHREALERLAAADVVLVVGSRLGDLATNAWTALPRTGCELVQIDRDAGAIGRNHPVAVGVVGDARAALEALVGHLPAEPRAATEAKAPAPGAITTAGPGHGVHPIGLLSALERAMPRDSIVTVDVGEHSAFAVHELRVEHPDRFHFFTGLGSMGSGIGAAIGIGAARPQARVVAICGDGGMAMHGGELLTCVENDLAVTFVVFNDGRYRMVDAGLVHMFGRRSPGLPTRVADWAAIARAVGARAETITSVEQLRAEHFQGPGPLVLDVRIDPDVFLSIETRLASLKHFAEGAR